MAKEKVPDINVIVVSGYGEFEYAKAALNYGAYSYLLKPVDRDELSDILSKLRDKILNEEEGKAERQERIRPMRRSSVSFNRADFVSGHDRLHLRRAL